MPDRQPAVTPVPGPQPAAAARRYRDVAELLAGATERTVLAEVPGKSGAYNAIAWMRPPFFTSPAGVTLGPMRPRV